MCLNSIAKFSIVFFDTNCNTDIVLLLLVMFVLAALMGKNRSSLSYRQSIDSNYAVIIPAGTWHNIVNTGNTPLKLYSIYAPPQHPFGTIHPTKTDAEND